MLRTFEDSLDVVQQASAGACLAAHKVLKLPAMDEFEL
jgi:hypothetical protein